MTPIVFIRVVCDLGDTAETLVPISTFMSSDLPAFGVPIMVTLHERSEPGRRGAARSCGTEGRRTEWKLRITASSEFGSMAGDGAADGDDELEEDGAEDEGGHAADDAVGEEPYRDATVVPLSEPTCLGLGLLSPPPLDLGATADRRGAAGMSHREEARRAPFRRMRHRPMLSMRKGE
jgi:hypothetical protein